MSSTTRHPRSAWPLIAGFVALAVVVVGAAYWAWAQQARSMRSQAERSVEAVGKLKAAQVASWMEERNGDAEIIHGDRLLSTAVADLLAGRSGPESAAKVRSYIADYQRIYDYAGVTLVAPDGRTVLQAPMAPRHVLDSSERALVAEAERTGQVTFSDLHLGEDDKPRMEIATPLAVETRGERAVASVLLILDPGTFLFPFIQTWPLHSATGETLLVELRDGRVLFLNELRHRKDTALRLTSSATDPELPAAMAVRGKRGIVEGYDYRDVPVIAALEAVSGTSWFVISKIDTSEVVDPIRTRGWLTAGFTLLVVALAAAGTLLLWRARESQAEAEIRESQDRYQALIENLSSGVVVHAVDTQIELANRRASELLGLSLDQLLGKTAMDPDWHFLDAAGIALPLDEYPVSRVLASGEPFSNLIVGVHRSDLDEPLWVLCSGYPARAADGSLADVVIIFSDVTEMVHTERELRASELKFRETIEALDEGYFSVTLDGVLLDHNPAYNRILGLDPDADLRGQHTPDFWRDPADRAAYIGKLTADGAVSGHLAKARTDDGTPIVVLLSAHVVHDDGAITRIDGSVVDFTARKAAEDEIARLNEELEQRVRDRTAQLDSANKELEAFAYSVSHDLRAPLRHINGFSEMLAKRSGETLDDKGRHYLDTIIASVSQMGVLIDDLLQFSRTGRAELQITSVDMRKALEEALVPLRHDIADRAIEWTIGPLPTVVGDHALLRQVWANLLGNAVKYTRGRAPAHIDVGARDGDEGEGNDGGGANEDVFWVRDDGVGFDMQYAHKLFGVFQRLHSTAEFEGTGIGLANVQRIVNRLGGRVWAEAGLDKGATFYFSLPRRKEPSSW